MDHLPPSRRGPEPRLFPSEMTATRLLLAGEEHG